MSGTSADGIDVALCRIGPGLRAGDTPQLKLIGHLATRYPKAVRAAVLRVMEGDALPAAELSRLNWRLGEIYADCVEKAAAKFRVKVGLVGCHGQTVHHQATAVRFLGGRVRSTWQTGEPAVIAERLRCPVVSDFRPADLAAGGQGAPLVPVLDYCLFRSPTKNRVLLNLGGIANVTVLPAGCTPDQVLAFDTGPGNMLIDALMQRLYRKPFDEGGNTAARGTFHGIGIFDSYTNAPPPKSYGREQFGSEFANKFIAGLKSTERTKLKKADIVATATWLTPMMIALAIERFCIPHLNAHAPQIRTTELIAAGGGTRNAFLMGLLEEKLDGLQIKLSTTDSLGIPAQAKEAVAFALLAWLTWNGLPGNIPAATGANRPVVLGKVSLR
jgi:anhydro-N-acetylmuramic acid kinase